MTAIEPPSPAVLLAHAGWVRGLARSLAADASSAEDLVQEAWLAALRRGPRDGEPLGRWLAVALRNFAGKARRSTARRAARELLAAREEQLPSTAELCERAEGHRRLVASVLALAEPSRTAILLRFFEELPPREIAARLGVPVRTVNSRIARGLAALRAELASDPRGDARALLAALLPLAPARLAGPGAAGVGLGLVLAEAKLALALALAVVLGIAVGAWQLGRQARPPAPPGASPELLAGELAERAAAPEREPHADGARTAAIASAPPAAAPEGPAAGTQRGLLTGIVVDRAEHPLADVTVEVLFHAATTFPAFELALTDASQSVARLTTDADGCFEIEVERGRPHDLVVHPPADGTLAGVRVPERYAAEHVRVVLLPAAAIEGFATRLADGTPVAGALVRVTHETDGSERETRTDAAGRYACAGLAPGTVGFQLIPEQEGAPPWKQLELEPGRTLRHDVELVSGSTASGRVLDARTGAPIANAEVTSWSFLFKNVRTDAGGRYTLSGLRGDRPVTLAARAPGYGRVERRFDPSAADAMDLALVPGLGARGRVVDEHGAPIEGAHVLARAYESRAGQMAEDMRAVRSGSDGSFALPDLRRDVPYALAVRQTGHATLLRAVPPPADPDWIELGELELAPSAGIAGRVVDARGRPVPSTWMELFPLSDVPTAWLVQRQLRTAADGRFACTDLDAGHWYLRVAPRGRAVEERHVELARGEQLELEVVLAAGLALGGRVVDPDGLPVADVEVGLGAERADHGGFHGAWRDRTDAEGRFEFVGLAAEPYTFTANPFGPWRDGVELAPARVTGVLPGAVPMEVALRALDQRVAGRVLAADGAPVPQAAVYVALAGLTQRGVLTDAEGRFELRVPGGEPLELCAVPTADIALASGNLTVLELRLGRCFLGEARACATGIEPGRRDVELRLPR